MMNMSNPDPKRIVPSRATPISLLQIAIIRTLFSIFITLAAGYFLWPILNTSAGIIVLAGFVGIALTTGIGYLLIRAKQEVLGLGIMTYGFLFSFLVIGIYIEGVGLLFLVAMLITTLLTVSTTVPRKRALEAIVVSTVLGVISLLVDINYRGAGFRIPTAEGFSTVVTILLSAAILVGLVLLVRQFPYLSLRIKLIAAFTGATILALSVLGYLNNLSVQRILNDQANESLFNAASQTESTLRQFIDFNLQSIKTEAKLPVFVDYLSLHVSDRADLQENIHETLSTLAESSPEYIASYALLDLDGNVMADTNSNHVGENESDLTSFMSAIEEGDAVMSPMEFDPFTKESSLYFSSPVVENDSIILGVLRVRYRAEVIQELVKSNNDRGGEGSFAVLFDENLIHLAHGIAPETLFTSVEDLDNASLLQLIADRRLPDRAASENLIPLPELAQNLGGALAEPGAARFFEATDVATGNLINRVVVINLQNPSWLLAFFQPQEIYLAPSEELANTTILLSIVSAAGSVVFAILISQVLASPIIALTNNAAELAKGNFDTTVEIGTHDEIGDLGQSFNSMASQLRSSIGSLETQVASRTKDLENQAAMLQASVEIARDATSEAELQPMLDRASTLLYDRFGYYHVGIYLLSDDRENAVLTASTDESGQKLLEVDHTVKVSVETNLGHACILGEPVRASASSSDSPLNFHALLPSSQAQLVIPLNLGNRTIGAIDLHSTNPNTFTEGESQIFQALADQLSIAIEKASFQQEIQKNLTELETAYGQFTQQSWEKFIESRAHYSGYRYDARQKVEKVERPTNEVIQAWEGGQPVSMLQKASGNAPGQTSLAIPIKVRGSVIGVLNIEFDGESVPVETEDLVMEISERLSLILENARLVETARRQVEREQLTSYISDQVRQSLDMDTVLKTAVQEIGQQLGLAEVELRLGDANPQSVKPTNGNRPQTSEEA